MIVFRLLLYQLSRHCRVVCSVLHLHLSRPGTFPVKIKQNKKTIDNERRLVRSLKRSEKEKERKYKKKEYVCLWLYKCEHFSAVLLLWPIVSVRADWWFGLLSVWEKGQDGKNKKYNNGISFPAVSSIPNESASERRQFLECFMLWVTNGMDSNRPVEGSSWWHALLCVPLRSVRLGIKCHYAREYGRVSTMHFFVCSMKSRMKCKGLGQPAELDWAKGEKKRERAGLVKRALGLSASSTQQVMWQDRSRATRRNDRQVNWQPSFWRSTKKKIPPTTPLPFPSSLFSFGLLFTVWNLYNQFLIQKMIIDSLHIPSISLLYHSFFPSIWRIPVSLPSSFRLRCILLFYLHSVWNFFNLGNLFNL